LTRRAASSQISISLRFIIYPSLNIFFRSLDWKSTAHVVSLSPTPCLSHLPDTPDAAGASSSRLSLRAPTRRRRLRLAAAPPPCSGGLRRLRHLRRTALPTLISGSSTPPPPSRQPPLLRHRLDRPAGRRTALKRPLGPKVTGNPRPPTPTTEPCPGLGCGNLETPLSSRVG
jgi:hypothetical protein